MGEWINICNVNDLKNNTIKKFTVKETEILIAKTESNFYAFPGMCPHMEAVSYTHLTLPTKA